MNWPFADMWQQMAKVASWWRYGLIALVVGISVGLNMHYHEHVGTFPLFFGSVMIGAWLGGFKGGMLATVLSTVAIQYYLMEPHASFGLLSSANIARLMLFLIEGVVISWAVAGLYSSRIQRREVENRYRQIVETASEGIWLADAQWRTTFVNHRMAQMLGYEPHEMLGRSIFEFIDEQSQAEQRERVQQREIGQRGSFDIQLRRSDGAGVWVHISATPFMDDNGKFVAVLAMATDISERKRIEAELAAYRRHLEKLVEQRSAELASSYDRLRMTERMATLGTLAAGLGHDMGNLLFPLRVRLDVIESQSLSPELAEHIAAIRASTEYLQRLSTGLGMLARDPERQPIRDEEEGYGVDLVAWYAQSAALLKNALPRNVTLECNSEFGGLRRIAMPQHHLTQAMFNLVHNAGVAMKERGGVVRIWAEPLADESAIRLYVCDSGSGMSDEVKQRCMEPFFTTKSNTTHSGLGLSLVQLLVQRVGGQVCVESELGRGTTFVLTIPTVSGAPSGSSINQEDAAAAETCDPPQQQRAINGAA